MLYCPANAPISNELSERRTRQRVPDLFHQAAATSAGAAGLRELLLFGSCSGGRSSSGRVFAAQCGVQRSAIQLIDVVNLLKRWERKRIGVSGMKSPPSQRQVSRLLGLSRLQMHLLQCCRGTSTSTRKEVQIWPLIQRSGKYLCVIFDLTAALSGHQ
jgi:hypothetical protein